MVGVGSVGLAGCLVDPEEGGPRVPGDLLGKYEVTAVLTESTCSSRTLEIPGQLIFDVLLSKHSKCLYWNSGVDPVCGTIAPDQATLAFQSESSWTLSEPKPGRPGCVIWRQDVGTGTWAVVEGENAFVAFAGMLSYAYLWIWAEWVGSQVFVDAVCGECDGG